MYHNKKIALFISHVYGEYQSNLCQGVVSQAEEYGYNTEIYTTSDGENATTYSAGEYSILNIPNFEDIAGVIFASETYTDSTLKNKITHLLAEHSECPVIDITEHKSDFSSIRMENNTTAGELTEHLIKVHSAKNIHFLGSANQRFYSDRRQQAYENAMAKHSLPLRENSIFLLNEQKNNYKEALQYFVKDSVSNVDAIVCYNDKLAVGLWLTAKEMGYSIPDDFAITGCDFSKPGQNLEPPLTTVSFPTYELGTSAVNALMALLQNKKDFNTTVIAKPIYRGTCGCHEYDSTPGFLYSQELLDEIADLESSHFVTMRMAADFSHAADIDEAMDILAEYALKLENCNGFYICLYPDWDSLNDSVLKLTHYNDEDEEVDSNNTMLLKLAIKNGKRMPECTFPKVSLLPKYIQDNSNSSYLVSPLFFEDKAFGYIALSFESNIINCHFKLMQWMFNVTQLLQRLHEVKRTNALSKHLEDMYLKDPLTGLFNQHGFNSRKLLLLDKLDVKHQLVAIIMDLDMLKTINDNFGHSEGDFALKVIGQALGNVADDSFVCSRFTGDEFYCVGIVRDEENAKEFILRVEKFLDNFNRQSTKPYSVSISTGYSLYQGTCPDDGTLSTLFETADKNMYNIKKNKVKKVLR